MINLKCVEKAKKRFFWEDRGAVAIIFALALLPMISFLGLTIDLGRVYYINSVMTGAADAGAIAGAKAGGTAANITQQARAFFLANIPANFSGRVSGPIVTLSNNNTVVTVSGSASIGATFASIFGTNQLTTTGTAQAQVSTQGAEVVLALDNTGSMSGSPMQGEIAAAQALVNILYGGSGTSGGTNTLSGLYVGVVPFTTTVNINMGGGFNPNTWLTNFGQAQIANTNLYPNIASTSTSVGGKWMGCIEARTSMPALTSALLTTYGYTSYPSGTDATDATPSQFPFTPFLYPSTYFHSYTYGLPLNRGTTSTSTNATLLTPLWLNSARGDNDWKSNGTVPATSLYTNPAPVFFGDNYRLNAGNPDGNYGVGPNLGCPIPMLPLTASQSTVQATLANMKATFRGGTMINSGLSAAWWMISPKWTGLWPAAYTLATEPQPYGNTLKVVILMTDGQNQWYDWPVGDPGQPATTVLNGQNDADYTGYGRLAEGRTGTTNFANTTTVLNNSMAQMCSTLQANGVVIYTILFNHDGSAGGAANQALFQNCASSPQNYFFSVTNADLLAAFSQIGQDITNLRLTWPGKP